MLCRENLRDLIDILVNSPQEDMPASLNLRVNGMLSRKRVKLIFFIEELKSECYLLIKMEL